MYQNRGYLTAVADFDNENRCTYYNLAGRGVYFNGQVHGNMYGIRHSADQTVEIWINPEASGVIYSFKVNRGLYNGILWVSDCQGLVLDFGYQQ